MERHAYMTLDQVRGRLWARRLKRVFNIDITACENCRGPVKIIACIEDPIVIAKILTHLEARRQPDPNRPPLPRGQHSHPHLGQGWSACPT